MITSTSSGWPVDQNLTLDNLIAKDLTNLGYYLLELHVVWIINYISRHNGFLFHLIFIFHIHDLLIEVLLKFSYSIRMSGYFYILKSILN